MIDLKDKSLKRLVFVHGSYLNERDAAQKGINESNERLEFLGDSILAASVSAMLYELYPSLDEGGLTNLRSKLVNTEALAMISRQLDLGSMLLLGKGERAGAGDKNPTILAGVFEAYIAALWLERGFEFIHDYMAGFFKPLIKELAEVPGHFDFKPLLQQVSQRLFKCSPEYILKDEAGPPHKRTFTVEALVNGEACGQGSGPTKKKAEQAAAEKAVEALKARYGG